MVRILLHGCNGHLGREISRLAQEDKDVEIVAGVDIHGGAQWEYPVFASLFDCDLPCDVLIDFSSYRATDQVLDFCLGRELPLVLCTTGLTDDQLENVRACSQKIAVLRSANMSLGIHVLQKVLQEAAKTLANAGFDVEIVEKHHRFKCDAPSGTALALADSINEATGGRYQYVYDRSQRHAPREEREIGISAVRGGTIVGDHEILFAGPDEVLTFGHRAYSKAVFGKGALEAAKFLAGRAPGMYGMRDVIMS